MKTLEKASAAPFTMTGVRPQVRGKFIFLGDDKLYVRGVTYGTFRPHEDGSEYPAPTVVERDFAEMAANGFNAVRTYTVPPPWLLDAAKRHGLFLMVGLPLERYVAYLEGRKSRQRLEDQVQTWVQECARHPAILCYALGNEIPSSIVRWHGPRQIEHLLKRLYEAAKAEDPDGLFTYVNYPSTEYLQLPFIDLVSFNVYLEEQDHLNAYLARLQNIAGSRPLIMAEIGLDSQRNGEDTQASTLGCQVRTAFASGTAGVFVYAWTDEWHRGGEDVEDWDFGLTDRARRPKPALAAVRDAFAAVPISDLPWPRISVVVCSYNGAHTIRDCLEGLRRLDYPNYEVIMIDDGSTDDTPCVMREYARQDDFRLISTDNGGLSSARNVGWQAATGEIVAYIDDDAYPDPTWLTYLAATFLETSHVAVGGPNLAPPGDGLIADCVANAPGGPTHILLSDQEAEHIPGCNMAFRRASLEAIGGFDPQFRTAGDDVDVCWQLSEHGWSLGFSPAALVWHHRRNSLHTYWKQQCGYGKAEALLERKWPEKYNTAGHPAWTGRLYGKGLTRALSWYQGRIYHGVWGSAPFQSLYQPADSTLCSLPLMPEWYLLVVTLAVLSALGVLWAPLLIALPLLALAVGILLMQAGLSAAHAAFTSVPRSCLGRLKLYSLTALLHMIQPLARLRGRLSHGLTLWRLRSSWRFAWPWPGKNAIWSEHWQAPAAWLQSIESFLQATGAVVLQGGDYDRWDLKVRGGLLGSARLRMAVEEHGAGKQLLRFAYHPVYSPSGFLAILLLVGLSTWAALDHALVVSGILGTAALLIALRTLGEGAITTAAILSALSALADPAGSVVVLPTLAKRPEDADVIPDVSAQSDAWEQGGTWDTT